MAKFLFLLFTLFILTNTYGQLTTITGKPRPLTEHELKKIKEIIIAFIRKSIQIHKDFNFFRLKGQLK